MRPRAGAIGHGSGAGAKGTIYQMIGFHLGVPSYADGLKKYLETVAEAGVPLCLVGADTAGPLAEAAQIAKQYGVPAALVYRKTRYSWGDDVPAYDADAEAMARLYWDELEAAWPRELDKNDVWVEFPNEPDRARAFAVGLLAEAAGREALRRGFRYLSPAWSAGNPEPEDWDYAPWLAYFDLCERHPGRLGVSLHEYTLDAETRMLDTVPWLMGRVAALNALCDVYDIALPPVVMTEWGWGANAAPEAETAVADAVAMLRWYRQHAPNVIGMALWALDSGWQWKSLSRTVNGYMRPLAEALIHEPWGEEEEPTMPDEKHKVVIYKLAQEHDRLAWMDIAAAAHEDYKRTLTASHDDMVTMLEAGNAESYAVVWDPEEASQAQAVRVLTDRGYRYEVRHTIETPPAPEAFELTHWPTDFRTITQAFGARPEVYGPYGFPGHEGVDIRALMGTPFYAAANGRVVTVTNKRRDGTPSNYGWYVVLDHGGGWSSLYAHAAANVQVEVGDVVEGGQVIATSGNTGNTTGPHLHFTLMHAGTQLPGWPAGYVDPTPFLERAVFVGDGRDMARYFTPPAGQERGDIVTLRNNWGADDEQCQLQRRAGGVLQVKNGLYEARRITEDRIYLDEDTSPGGGEFYRIESQTGWLPRRMKVGQEYLRVETVTFRAMADCRVTRGPYTTTSGLRFVQAWDAWESPHGVMLRDVAQLAWVVQGNVVEHYLFAAGLGLVGWQNNSGMQSGALRVVPRGQTADPSPRLAQCR